MSLITTIRQEVARSLATTPGYLSALLAGVCGAAILFLLAIVFAVQEHRSALKAVCQDSAPSIVAAQHIKFALSDLDANAANFLIAPPGETAGPLKAYDQRRHEISDNLLTAAENITYGDAERIPIKTIDFGLSEYEAYVTRARALHEAGSNTDVDAYIQGTQVMHDKLLPAADALDKANRDVLDDVYAHQRVWANISITVVLIATGILLAALVYLQLYLSRRMQRTFNVGLLTATGMVLGFLLMVVTALVGSNADLKWAKEDAFDSIHALWIARAVAYDANGAESRWLLALPAGKGADAYEKEFSDKTGQVAKLPPGKTYAQVATDSLSASGAKKADAGFTGKLADELNNITFPHELENASKAVLDWGKYVAIDGRIRDLEKSGRHADAVKLCCGSAQDESNGAFDAFDKDLDTLIDINQKQFEQAYKSGTDRLNLFEPVAVVVAIAICILAFIGLRPRFQEYTV